ncbi:MAG: hypothetical protein JWP97_5639 [Labilithrix sp.]|nr:hypothetical protein [Labilithrix sp.]
MRIVIFGLAVSSAWGNGHATLWRGLLRGLAEQGHRVTFYEHDTPYYAAHRDLHEGRGWELVLYPSWDEVTARARADVAGADAAIVTSYQVDAQRAAETVLAGPGMRVFYDLDTPVTLEALGRGEIVPYLPVGGLRDFDLVLSYTGGAALTELERLLGARRTAPLYGSVDPEIHRPASPGERFAADLSYLGTHAPDRRPALERLFLDVASQRPDRRFFLGGAMYPEDLVIPPNVRRTTHVAPPDHAELFASSRLTLNLTRDAMARMGYCPSGRLFEAAACGAPIVTTSWEGLDAFFEPGRELVMAETTEDVLAALDLGDDALRTIARRARERALAEHTAAHRARELAAHLAGARASATPATVGASGERTLSPPR